VLVTGATGALGAHVARHLVATHGVRDLVLASRHAAEAPSARALRDELERAGARVTLAACDASDRAALAQLLASLPAAAPLTAVFHCAGSVDDGALAALTPARIDRVFASKVDAALHLDELTRELPLSAFVLFSSVAGVLGTAGQANYAAANAFLDALAARRAQAGLAGQSVAWGLWEPSQTGMTAMLNASHLARIRRGGITPLSIAEGLALLDDALDRREPLLVPVKLDLSAVRTDESTGMLRKLVKPAPLRAATTIRTKADEGPSWIERFAELSTTERQAALTELIRTEAAGVFRLPGHVIPDDEPLKSLGLDSLMALELRDRLGAKLGMPLPATLAFDHPTIGQIVQFLHAMLPAEGGVSPPRSDDRVMAPRPLLQSAREIEELSNDELVKLVRSL
jgi:NAD(P)-dependent dehydrogenase (short-subunit alcohol dehydrogenase family)/acyl carrier protein